ncbi:rhamnosyltransferase [Ferrigenium kumadai]|uniref:Rhamnosyltransferase n=1 Tax=Ferrigenium kumadai TaxID=1682490 RepID=A0AAN1SZV4_9PROT|nr:glycosyltransferase family 2 protein [Ferrigenium kumadai]BBJ00029.1 rhamnosyltransferase [Ferrigenium kumadai]
MKASVVIPTKNGGPSFAKVLDALLQQETPWEFEILVIDSGSTDDTVENCKQRSVPVLSIPPAEFGHGRTRNLGISKTGGEFIALITQDALPANNQWLFNLVSAVERAPDVAGAFGRHLPYPEARPCLKRDLKLHFDHFLRWPSVIRRSDDEQRYEREEGYRQMMHFFSDNNACLRRSVWVKYPYPDVDFAEDQIWAKTIIDAGFAKAYADNAVVYHSHNYSVIEAGRRAFDESMALNRLFGYKSCPTIAHLLATILYSIAADTQYVASNCHGVDELRQIVTIPFLNFSRMVGRYLGTKWERLPKWMVRTISLDKALQAS